MKRKAIQQGPSTIMVSLPSKWIKENSIHKGDELNLDIQNNQLVISITDTKPQKESLHIKKTDQYLDRLLMAKYRDGANEIYIKYDEPEIIEKIKHTLKFLLGFEIVHQTAQSCTIKNISEASNEDYPTMFRRMFQIMLTMSESCLEYVHSNDEKHLKTAIDLRETLTKLEQFNLRLINKKNNVSLEKKSLEFFYVWNIATFGKMWSSLAKKQLPNARLSTEDKNFFKNVVAYSRNFYNIYYSKDQNDLLKLKTKLYNLRPIGAKLLDTSKNKMTIFYLLKMINRIYETTLAFDI